MKSKSVLNKLLLLLIITMILGTYITTYVVSNKMKEVLDEELHEEIFIILQTLDWAIEPLLNNGNYDEIQRLIDQISEYPIVANIRLYQPNQQIQFSNIASENNVIIENACVLGVFEEGAESKSIEDFDNKIYEAAMPVRGSGVGEDAPIEAVLFIAADMEYVFNLWNDVINDFQVVFIISNVLLVIIITLYVYFVIGRPLKEFKLAADAITNKNYDYTMKDNMEGEFIELKTAYDDMRNGIKAYISELDQSRNEVEEASNAKMIFLTNMSHEIRTPLNSILGFTELLEEDETNSDKRSQLHIIHKSSTHLLSVINDLLDFSKIENNQMEVETITFSMRELVRDTSDFFYLEMKKRNLGYRYEVSSRVPMQCRSDENKIRQILINLISNSMKFTKEGEIFVEVDYIDPMLIIKVTDTGIGISEDKMETIFEAFSQSDNSIARKYGGTGLGLSICKKFSLLLNGDITVDSEIGSGTVFTVKLKVIALDSQKLIGRGILCSWLNADSDLADLVFETILTLPSRMKDISEMYKTKEMEAFQGQIHALKGLCGNFQMDQLYNLFVAADRELKKPKIDFKIIDEIMIDINNIVFVVSEAANNHCNISNTKVLDKEEQTLTYKTMDILVAEDVKENQLLVDRMLKPLNHHLQFANNGLEAMELMKAHNFDCMLLDIQMPEMSGEEVLDELANNFEASEIKNKPYIIVLTAHATVEEKERCISLGANDYLSKPINKAKLRSTIKDLSLRIT